MKIKDKEFIREIVSSDFKHISNPNFTSDTLEKIAALEDSKKSYSNSGDITFLIPQILYASLLILLSLVTVIISWTQSGQKNDIMHSIEMISEVLLNPVTISILFSFSILYLIDLYLKKASA
jgi:hypothetical protein